VKFVLSSSLHGAPSSGFPNVFQRLLILFPGTNHFRIVLATQNQTPSKQKKKNNKKIPHRHSAWLVPCHAAPLPDHTFPPLSSSQNPLPIPHEALRQPQIEPWRKKKQPLKKTLLFSRWPQHRSPLLRQIAQSLHLIDFLGQIIALHPPLFDFFFFSDSRMRI
jgi:hypothetical protein